jgi:hypothetical protein
VRQQIHAISPLLSGYQTVEGLGEGITLNNHPNLVLPTLSLSNVSQVLLLSIIEGLLFLALVQDALTSDNVEQMDYVKYLLKQKYGRI